MTDSTETGATKPFRFGVVAPLSTELRRLSAHLDVVLAGFFTEYVDSGSDGLQVFTANVTNDLVIQRNFDPFTLKPTRYVNGHKWTYTVGTFPTGVGGGTYRDAAEIAIDQAGDQPFINSAVSAAVVLLPSPGTELVMT